MTNEQIKELALAHGFKLKEQPNGSKDFHPYIYELVRAALARACQPNKVYELRYMSDNNYYSLCTTLDRELLVKFIDDAKAYDADFIKRGGETQYYNEHPLAKFGNDWVEHDFDYQSAADLVNDTWASALEIVETELWTGD